MIHRLLSGRVAGRLGFRLMAAIGVALMPLALLSYNQAQKYDTESVARWESALFGETLLAAASQIDAISRARGMAAALAAAIVVPKLNLADACIDLMQMVNKTESTLNFAGYIPIDGQMTCGSTGTPFSFAGTPGLAPLLADPKPMMTVNPKGPITGEPVLIFTHPVRTQDQRLIGFISLSMQYHPLEARPAVLNARAGFELEPLSLMTFDGRGTVLTSTSGMNTAYDRLPSNRKLMEFVNLRATTFRDSTFSGQQRTFAVVTIVPGSLYVLSSWPFATAANASFADFLPLWIFPLAIWLASMLVAYLAAEGQVLRHVRSLRKSITAFAGGDRIVAPPDMSDAPNELRDVGQAYERLMGSVLYEAAQMEDQMCQKEVLLREVHHRVKNNLQLIASIMNLQIRKSVNPEARAMLRNLHERVMSLATIHRELYQTSGLTDVHADELLESIVTQVLCMGASAEGGIEAKTTFDPIRLSPDQAVPLSLILTEALTNALKHGISAQPGTANLCVSLLQTGPDTARLEVSNAMRGDGDITPPNNFENTGLGQQLLAAFASQLEAKVTVGPIDGQYVVRLDFPLHGLPPSDRTDEPVDALPEALS